MISSAATIRPRPSPSRRIRRLPTGPNLEASPISSSAPRSPDRVPGMPPPRDCRISKFESRLWWSPASVIAESTMPRQRTTGCVIRMPRASVTSPMPPRRRSIHEPGPRTRNDHQAIAAPTGPAGLATSSAWLDTMVEGASDQSAPTKETARKIQAASPTSQRARRTTVGSNRPSPPASGEGFLEDFAAFEFDLGMTSFHRPRGLAGPMIRGLAGPQRLIINILSGLEAAGAAVPPGGPRGSEDGPGPRTRYDPPPCDSA